MSISASSENQGELPSDVMGILQASIHTEPTGRREAMRRVTNKEHPVVLSLEMLRNLSVHSPVADGVHKD